MNRDNKRSRVIYEQGQQAQQAEHGVELLRQDHGSPAAINDFESIAHEHQEAIDRGSEYVLPGMIALDAMVTIGAAVAITRMSSKR